MINDYWFENSWYIIVRYVGEFSSGVKNGRGVMHYRSGESREGFWSKDKLIGRVILRTLDGGVKEEFWKDKSFDEEKLVKMGDMNNFHSLLETISTTIHKPTRKLKASKSESQPLFQDDLY